MRYIEYISTNGMQHSALSEGSVESVRVQEPTYVESQTIFFQFASGAADPVLAT